VQGHTRHTTSDTVCALLTPRLDDHRDTVELSTGDKANRVDTDTEWLIVSGLALPGLSDDAPTVSLAEDLILYCQRTTSTTNNTENKLTQEGLIPFITVSPLFYDITLILWEIRGGTPSSRFPNMSRSSRMYVLNVVESPMDSAIYLIVS
jgi:hypothetical protein